MYAIVSIAGQQFKVEKGKKVFVHRLQGEIGDEISFEKVMLISNNDKVNVGAPYINDAVVLAQIVSHLRGDKVLVFKKKRRKTYQKLNGHRQDFTEILIEEISETGVPKQTEKKKTAAPKADVPEIAETATDDAKEPAVKAAPKKPAPKTGTKKAMEEKAVEKKATEKKPAAKKPAAKIKTDKSSK